MYHIGEIVGFNLDEKRICEFPDCPNMATVIVIADTVYSTVDDLALCNDHHNVAEKDYTAAVRYFFNLL